MAVTELIGVMTNIDKNGNKSILYPVTKAEAVEGLEWTPIKKLVRHDTLAWNGNTDGLIIFDMMGNGEYTYYLVSENVPTMEDLENGVYIELVSPDGEDIEKITLNDFFIHGNNIIVSQSVSSVLFVLEDNVSFYGNTIPKKGVYFMSSETYGSVSKIVIDGYEGFCSFVLKESDLPDRYSTKQEFKELSEKVIKKDDVVDNLLSTATNLPLSANQGRILNEKSLLQNYRHYKWISDFGCTSYVFKDVLTAMPTQSVLTCEAHDFCAPNGITSTGYATLRITKCTDWRILIEIIHHGVGVIAWTGNMTELDNINLKILTPIITATVQFGESSVAAKSWGNFNVLNKYTPPTGYTIISSNWHFGGTGYGACRFFPRGITSYDFVNDANSTAVVSCSAYLVLQRTSI